MLADIFHCFTQSLWNSVLKAMATCLNTKADQTPWHLVHKLTIPTEPPPQLVPAFVGRVCCVVSAVDSYGCSRFSILTAGCNILFNYRIFDSHSSGYEELFAQEYATVI
jgi:hypothetical protein